MRGNQHGDGGRRNGHDGVVGAKFFDQRENANDERAAADEHDADDEDRGDAGAQPAIDAEDEAVRARLQSFLRRERHHHFGARFADQVGDGNELIALSAQRVDDLGQRGTVWVRSPPPSWNRMMLPSSAWRMMLSMISCSGIWFAAGNLLPIVRVDLLADDQIAHILRDRKLRDFFGVFGLMIDAVRRAKQNGFHADGAFDQALCQIQLPADLRLGDFVKVRMRVGVIADFVAFGVLALEDFRDFRWLARRLRKKRPARFSP